MEVDDCDDGARWSGRWNHLQKILERNGPFVHPDFEPSPDILDFMLNSCKVLVVGAGGLGCELLKDLSLMGLRHIHVIDMDTIDLSNLNRQFLFRQCDIGKPKAEVAASFINKRVKGTKCVPHFCRIQDHDSSFYKQFHIVVCGLDSIVARRWINGMLISLLEYDEDGNLDPSSLIPLVDGGTEGFKGNARVILPGMNACMDCTLDLYPPQVNFPMCTIAHTPRQPEHCIEYVKIFQWEKEKPFGDIAIDGDDPDHIKWICKAASTRADEYGIQGVNYRLTQGVIKRIIPAVASTNAVIAAACANEVFKLATSCSIPLNNYMVFNDTNGVYTYTFEAERNEQCLACNNTPRNLSFKPDALLREVVDFLCQDNSLQMKSPGLTTTIEGLNKTLYMKNIPSLEAATRPNLSKSLKDLGIVDGQEVIVADVTTPNSLRFKIKFNDDVTSS
uniref:NEDD8-activating enzyme E1 catalytic subunit n=1 Tax=Ciona intestinalis TaxID=7719 RepID=UPI0000522697|nr:NEDD8-activating enzyme E1 catalytic subunit [Ciona intestinalis]|eukprot:XP_002128360.1 NEDD8-activating enzyme E1 catalytic subunit [Ciona intestinalis]